jgi:hypothetical protein
MPGQCTASMCEYDDTAAVPATTTNAITRPDRCHFAGVFRHLCFGESPTGSSAASWTGGA